MSKYFALVNSDNVVEDVIVAEQDFVDANPAAAGKQWIETFMNDAGGKRYAGVGMLYDPGIQDFLSPKPFPSWTQNGNQWDPPVAKPSDGQWKWNEDTQSWDAWNP